MTFATVRGAAEEAAKKGKLTPHQLAALSALDQALTDEQRELFTDAWRAQGSPAEPAPNPFAAVKPLLDLIAAGEGDYTSVNRGKAGDTPAGWPGLDRLTIGAVQKLQSDRTLFAVGRYQFIPETLRMAVAAAGFRASDLFSPETQDWLAVALLLGGKRPALRDYLQGKNVTIEAAQLDLAKEWASIPTAEGRGVYDGDSAGNKATAKVAKVQSALKAARAGLAGRTLPQLRLPAQQPAAKTTTPKFTPASPFSSKITPHVTYGELALGEEARRFTAQHQCDTALELCQFIEKARAAFGGKPAIITSGYRPPAVNKSVGGASQSEHLYDAPGVGAVDFYLEGVPVKELQDWADRAWPYSLGYGAPKGFIHIGKRKGGPRVRWDY
jgi:hypothetical protein